MLSAACGSSTPRHSVDDGERKLSFSHVVARRLSYLLRVVIVEYVVAYLEYDAKVLSEQFSSLYVVFRCP